MSEVMGELLELERQKASQDFYWFSKYHYGNKDMQPATHREMCELLQKWRPEKHSYEELFLLPRGVFKTSIGSESYPTWELILRNRNLRVLLAGETLESAKRRLGAIKAKMESEEFVSIYGDVKNDPKTGKPIRWNEDQIILAGRTGRGQQLREASITASAPGSAHVGNHFDIIILDDIVSGLTVTTAAMIQKTLEYYRECQSLLDPGGKIIIIGTRWSHDDLYSYLLGNNESKKPLPDEIIVKKAINPDGTPFFPERLSLNVLAEIRQKIGDYKYNCQYENDPISKETQIFKPEWVKHFDSLEDVPRPATRFLLVDPAATVSESSDYSAAVIVEIDSNKEVWVSSAEQRKCEPHELIDWIIDLHRAFKFDRIGIEEVVFSRVLSSWLKQKMLEPGVPFLPIVPVKVGTRVSKEMRIRSLQPFYQAGKVHHLRGALVDLEKQMARFPVIKHDDLLDALSNFGEIAYSPAEFVVDTPPPDRNLARFPEPTQEKRKDHWVNWGL